MPWIKAGEVWWCRLGENIGTEINGKNAFYLRPVYILKKVNRYSAVVIPLTSKEKYGSWFCDFYLGEKHEFANLSQIRAISLFRLENKIGTVGKETKELIKRRLMKFLL